MADKMMRMAGRAGNGTAKAVSTDENGRLVTKATVTRDAFTSGALNAGTSIEIGPLSSEGYPFAQLNIKFTNKRRLRLSKKDDNQAYEVVGEANGNYVFQYAVTGTSYYLKLENIDTSGGYLSYSKENLMSAPISNPITKTTLSRDIFVPATINAGSAIEIGPIYGEGYPFAQLNIKFTNKRRLRLSKKDDGQSYEVVGEAVGDYVFQYPIMGKSYYLKLENIDTLGGYLSYSKENLISAPMQKPTSRIASTRINFPDVTAGSYERVAFSAPYGKTYDILYITARAKTTGTGTISLNMTLNEPNLYSEMFNLVGSNIELNVSDFGASNNSAIEIPSKFNPGEVLELQRYIREIANVPESPSANYFKLGNNSNVTVTDAVVYVYYIERTV